MNGETPIVGIMPGPMIATYQAAKAARGAKVRGKFASFNGTLELDEADLTKSKVEVSMDVASVNTSEDKRDAHLHSGDFFDAEKFPTATFKGTSITKSGDGYLIKGDRQ
jgi:polyisoprenoid-binding protein YceI